MKKVILLVILVASNVIMISCTTDQPLNPDKESAKSADYGGNNDPRPIVPPKP